MTDTPWLTLIGMGEDGPDGLPPASLAALKAAEIIMGPPRHLSLLPELDAERVAWPVPFADGLDVLAGFRGRKVAVLASGDPFWYGAGAVIAQRFVASEMRVLPGVSTFARAAAQMGWRVEDVLCLGLHAAPFERLRPDLAPGVRALLLMRDGPAVKNLSKWLTELEFGDSTLHVMEALGGPRARVRTVQALGYDLTDVAHPVCLALNVAGTGAALPRATGRADNFFDHDGQITKRPLRALTLSALAPLAGEHLWDIGAGAGSIALEWLLTGPDMRATAIEADRTRAARIAANAGRLGVENRLNIIEARAPDGLDGLDGLDPPDAVFIGGGLSDALLRALWSLIAPGARVVANAVTLDSEALLADWHARAGGDLMRVELAHAGALGSRRGWKSAYPVVQWSVRR